MGANSVSQLTPHAKIDGVSCHARVRFFSGSYFGVWSPKGSL